MSLTRRNFKRGTLLHQIEFNPGRALSTTGGNGELYLGKLHLKSHPDGSPFQYSNVALKRMRWGTDDEDTRLDSIIEETYIWKRIIHPNVLRFLGLLYEDDDIYLVAPFAPHGTLPQYIVAHPDTNRPTLLGQVSAGIAHLHEQNIIHGDLKGANVLVFDGPTVKICDFGLSKFFDGKQSTTPRYSLPWTSPERLDGEPRSFLSDVYAFGMTIYEILSGKEPFSTLEYVACVKAIMNGERPPKHPESATTGTSYTLLWYLAERCWQSQPDERPPMKEVHDSIASAEGISLPQDDSDCLPLFSLPPASSDVAGQKRKRVQSISDSAASAFPDGLVRTHAEGPWVGEVARDVETRRDVKRRKLQGVREGETVEGEWVINSPAVVHDSRQSTVMSTWVGVHRVAPQPLATTHSDHEMDELRIVGATVVRHDELKNLVPLRNRNKATGFWNDLVEADVANKRSLVKMYYKRSGGEKAFLRDIERLGDCLFGLPRIRAYCLKASVPFIVLEAEATTPLREHLLNLAKNLAVDVADKKIWDTIANLNTAANFVSEHCQDIRISALSAALKDVRVDQDGRIAIAPDWANDPNNSIEDDFRATELTRNMLKEMLMGDHTFHRFSCISFTFGAASWDYMSREEVLKLSDAATAKAHLCANADASLSPARRDESAKQAYEAWMQCPCLSHGVIPLPPTRPMAHILSTLDNQALCLGLSSQEQSAISDLIDLMNSETVEQTDVIATAQKSDTLPPKVWALLLIADGSQHIPGGVSAQQDLTQGASAVSSPLQQQQQQGDTGVPGVPHHPGWPANMTPQQQRAPTATSPPQQTSPQFNPQTPAQQWDRFFMDTYNMWLRNRNLSMDQDRNIDGKDVELEKLFLLVRAFGGQKNVTDNMLWPTVGGRIGFFQAPSQNPESSAQVATKLYQIYQRTLADFEQHWYNSLRPQDPTSTTIPLPKHLQGLHPEITRLSIKEVGGPNQQLLPGRSDFALGQFGSRSPMGAAAQGGSAKWSPSSKPAPPPASTPKLFPSTAPLPSPILTARIHNLATPISRLGTSNLGAGLDNDDNHTNKNRFPFTPGANVFPLTDLYPALDTYDISQVFATGGDLTDADFDKYFLSNLEDNMSAAAGGSN